MEAIKRQFAQYFKRWNIELPEPDLAGRSPGFISQGGWGIRYVFGRDSGREYLEFYAAHRMTNDRHLRIYEDGECVVLEAICSGYGYYPDKPGDAERAERESREKNRRIYKELQEKGLDMMSMNTCLSLSEATARDKK